VGWTSIGGGFDTSGTNVTIDGSNNIVLDTVSPLHTTPFSVWVKAINSLGTEYEQEMQFTITIDCSTYLVTGDVDKVLTITQPGFVVPSSDITAWFTPNYALCSITDYYLHMDDAPTYTNITIGGPYDIDVSKTITMNDMTPANYSFYVKGAFPGITVSDYTRVTLEVKCTDTILLVPGSTTSFLSGIMEENPLNWVVITDIDSLFD
jgi:hypothetical protein